MPSHREQAGNQETGIERILITSNGNGRGSYRFWESQRRWAAANRIYRSALSLLPGDSITRCTQDEFEAGYDRFLGVDALLRLKNGMILTLQEKFLTFPLSTVTVEYYQNPKTSERGDWFHLKAQLYFVGYDRAHLRCPAHPDHVDRETQSGICWKCGHVFLFQDWILLDWAKTVVCTNEGQFPWRDNRNKRDGARASFKYTEFFRITPDCILASSNREGIH